MQHLSGQSVYEGRGPNERLPVHSMGIVCVYFVFENFNAFSNNIPCICTDNRIARRAITDEFPE